MTGRQLGPEFSLLARCCRWNFARTAELPPIAVPSDLDWSFVVALARRHRVQGLVWNAVSRLADRLPVDARDALSSDARRIAATNMAIARECAGLHQLFREASVRILFIKGLTVAALAYRSPMLKMGWDIDLLIDPGDLGAAARLLTDRGYTVSIPTNPDGLHRWHELSKESVWHRDDSFYVELHTRLADNRRMIPSIDARSPQQHVDVAQDTLLPTLADEELFAYLAVHGASSAWFRLKWIADFAALLDGQGEQEIDRLYRRSQDLGAGRAAGQALLLADMLFEVLSLAPGLRQQLVADRAARQLRNAALKMLTGDLRDPTDRPLGTLAIHWTQFLLLPDFDYKLSELSRQASSMFTRG